MLKISEFSKQSNFSIRMLRYLKEQGLLLASRRDNNYRYYREDQLEDAQEIKDLQEVGLQLKEIIELKNDLDSSYHITQLKKVLEREIDISIIKSSTIPKIKGLITALEIGNGELNLFNILKNKLVENKQVRIRSNNTELERVAYNIPFLKELYEDYLAEDSKIDLIETNIIYFKDITNLKINYQVYNILDKSSFIFGLELSESFIHSYIKNWIKFIPNFNLEPLKDFTPNKLVSVMGSNEMVIQTKFRYRDSNTMGEIVIPYTPIYTVSKFRVLK